MTTTYDIDLTNFGLPNCESVKFTFIDPVYTWIGCCNALHEHGIPMFWEPKTLRHPETGEQVYGAGIQYSDILRAAHGGLRASGRIAMFNINWDGGITGFGSRSCTPIHVQVMNTNSSSTMSVGLVGYVPYIDVSESYRKRQNYLDARFHVLQECIGHILDAIERWAHHGFKCVIGDETMVLFPRVGVMSLDTPERVKYFGLRSMCACIICRRRKGRSVTREATHHCPVAIESLYNSASAPNEDVRTRPMLRARKRARQQLGRYGLDWKKRCRLNDHAKKSLVHIDHFGPRLYGGLCRFERMHVYFIGYCGYLMELLVASVAKREYGAVKSIVRQCHQFRDSYTGSTHPRLPHLLKMTHLTAERRVRAIFYWAHVLGLRAAVIQEHTLRMSAQRAVASLQLILIAIRGHRAYTSSEMDVIFKAVGRTFFQSLETMAEYHERIRFNKKNSDHRRDPERHPMPVLFHKAQRSVLYSCYKHYVDFTPVYVEYACRDQDESDTVSTDSDKGWGGLGFFEYSQKALPHALEHVPELVKTFGHHAGVCTCVGEAGHKINIKNAARFGRTYADRNETQDGMLEYVQRQELWVAVNKLIHTVPADNVEQDSSCDAADEGVGRRTPRPRIRHKLHEPLHYTDNWAVMQPVRGRPPPMWGATFLSKRVLITRNELLTLLRTKLQLEDTWENITRLALNLHWSCFGVALLQVDGRNRKIVGVSSQSARRDFVRLKGYYDHTALSAQVIMFVSVDGFGGHSGIDVPESLRSPVNTTCTQTRVTLALVRWLSPDPRARERDSKQRPLCPEPFNINHALWTFSKRHQRPYFSDHMFARQLHLFPGSSRQTRRDNAMAQSCARYGLVQLETIDTFMNCTSIDGDADTILETITIPFV